MGLREHIWNGSTWQFHDHDAPEGAVAVDAAPAEQSKGRAPANKARTPKNKAVKPAANKASAKTEKPAAQKPTGKPDPASDPDASE
jgi:hypothetical protein